MRPKDTGPSTVTQVSSLVGRAAFSWHHLRSGPSSAIYSPGGERGSDCPMKLSTRARYALRMMVEIAKQTEQRDTANVTVSLQTVSENTNISRRYLEQLAIALKNASLIRGKTGKGGGYNLAHPAKQIRIGEIIEAAIGPINIVDCVREPEVCEMNDECGCRPMYMEINQRITDTLNELTLHAIAKSHANGKKSA